MQMCIMAGCDYLENITGVGRHDESLMTTYWNTRLSSRFTAHVLLLELHWLLFLYRELSAFVIML